MTIDEAVALIRKAVARFSDANIDWKRSRIGIFGIWVGDNILKQLDSPLQRAQLSETAWAQLHKDLDNPYTCVVKFISLGGNLGRWENGILDIYLPDGGKFGIFERTLRQAG